MRTDSARTVAVAVLAVLAIAVAAATLGGPTLADGEGDPGAGDAAGEESAGESGLTGGANHSETLGTEGRVAVPAFCVPLLLTWQFLAVAGVALAGVVAAFYRAFGGLGVVAGTFGVTPPLLLVYAFLTDCGPDPERGGTLLAGGLPNGTAAGTAGGDGAAVPPGLETSVPVVVVGALLVVVLVAGVRMATEGEPVRADAGSSAEATAETLAAVGAAAGEAADRIEDDADPDNGVYRAWHEMTRHLDVASPAASSPAEFEAAAVEAGMDPDDVAALTDLFREVRYGDAEPTAERERRAVAALRRIEREYAADGTDAAGGADTTGGTDGPDES